MKKFPKFLTTAAVVLALTGGTLALSANTAEAQGPGGRGGITVMRAGGTVNPCSTTDYTDVAAKALGMTATELRVALASRQSLQQIATSKGVALQTVTDALLAARKADIEQAVKDGILTQAQADLLLQVPADPAAQPTAQPPAAPGQPGGRGGRDGRGDGRMGRPGVRILMADHFVRGLVSARNTVKPYPIAATALGMSCADLVKAAQAGQSVAEVAASKGVALQTVTDALTKAYTEAIDKDLAEGLIAKVQADAQKADLINRVLRLVSQSARGGRMGIRGMGFGMGADIVDLDGFALEIMGDEDILITSGEVPVQPGN
jgi:hypothetical protein